MLKPLVLKNGLTIIRIPKTGTSTFLTGFITMSGSSHEAGEFPQGISHLVERLFQYGTDKHPSSKSLNVALESIGASFYSHTGQEMTEYYLTVPTAHQYKAVSVLSEIMQHSYFELKDIEQEKQNIVEQLKNYDNPNQETASPLALSNLYLNHSLGLPVIGAIETVMNIKKADIDNYLFHQYHTNRSYLILAGNFDNKSIMELVDQEWSYWNPKNRKFVEQMPVTEEVLGQLPSVQYRQRGLGYTEIAVAFLLPEGMKPVGQMEPDENGVQPEYTDEDIEKIKDRKLTDLAELMVLNTVLGQGYSSRLWSKGVEDELFFSRIQSDLIQFTNTGYLQINGITENSQFTFALECVLSSVDALKKTTVSINELAKSKEYLKGRLIMENESLLGSTMWQCHNLLGSSLIYELEDLIAKINKVEANAVRALALDLFVPERMAITTLGTAKETRLVEKLISKYIG
jgi:predicted Zn-dependent peptidase